LPDPAPLVTKSLPVGEYHRGNIALGLQNRRVSPDLGS
jgi:hypothetical protein